LASKQEVIRTSGGHHFGHGYDVLEQRILSGWEKRVQK
jgi:type IV secretory pathway VirJ component